MSNLSRRPFLDNLTVFMLVGSGRYLYHILTVSDFGLDFGSDVSQDVVLDGTRENLAIIKIMQFKRFEAKFAVKKENNHDINQIYISWMCVHIFC